MMLGTVLYLWNGIELIESSALQVFPTLYRASREVRNRQNISSFYVQLVHIFHRNVMNSCISTSLSQSPFNQAIHALPNSSYEGAASKGFRAPDLALKQV